MKHVARRTGKRIVRLFLNDKELIGKGLVVRHAEDFLAHPAQASQGHGVFNELELVFLPPA